MKQKVSMVVIAVFLSFLPLLTIAEGTPSAPSAPSTPAAPTTPTRPGTPAAVPPTTPARPGVPTEGGPTRGAPTEGGPNRPATPTNLTAPTGRGDISYSLQNPLAFDSIQDFIVAVLNVVIVLAIPVVVIFIILAGFQYVAARGDAAKVQKATLALTYSVIGGVLIIGAVAIAEIIKNLVSSFS